MISSFAKENYEEDFLPICKDLILFEEGWEIVNYHVMSGSVSQSVPRTQMNELEVPKMSHGGFSHHSRLQ